MRDDAQKGQLEREAIDEPEESLYPNDKVYHAREEFLRDYGVLFYEFGKVIETGSCIHPLISCLSRRVAC